VHSPTRWVITASLIAGVLCAGTTYFTHDPRPYREQAKSAANDGQFERAAKLWRKQIRLDEMLPHDWYEYGLVLKKTGQDSEALESFRLASKLQTKLVTEPTNERRPWGVEYYNLACYRALAGEREAAMDALELAAKRRYVDNGLVNTDPDLDSLRQEPRFITIVEGINRRRAQRAADAGMPTPPSRDDRPVLRAD